MKSFDCDDNKWQKKHETGTAQDFRSTVEPDRIVKTIPSKLPSKRRIINYKLACMNNNEESRSLSLPDCAVKKNINLQNNSSSNGNCDIGSDLLDPNNLPDASTDIWFKTWPERYDKLKSTDSSPNHSIVSIPKSFQNDRIASNLKNVKNKFTLNEALQSISLAYSPVTKQLHLVEPCTDSDEKISGNSSCQSNETYLKKEEYSEELTEQRKSGHKRTEAGSFSSTISTLSYISEPSTSGSLIGADDRSVSSFNISNTKTRKKSLTNFFSKHVFLWKGNTNEAPSNSIWKLFSKSSCENVSPMHAVASSSALIQHERPSNLPAKNEKEEQRHRDEYKAILLAAKRKEVQSTAAKQKQQKLQLKLEEQQAAAAKHFTQHVLPNWDVMRMNKKTLDLWWQGLPSSIRGKVWRLAIGNELNLTSQLYEICLCRAQNRLNSPEPPQCDSNMDQESSMDVIQLDISRTFPHLCIFQEGGPFSETLHSLLAAYVCYRPDVGYVQGMSYIAAILILNMEQFDAFICFANLLNQPLHLSAFSLNQTQMQTYYNAYNIVFSYNLPKLHLHFEKSGLSPDLYLLDWIYTIFAKAMPLDIACRVWDIFLRDGYEFIFRTALGILHLNQHILMEMDFLHGAQFLTRLPEDMSSEQLFKSIQLVTTNVGKQTFNQIFDKCLTEFGS